MANEKQLTATAAQIDEAVSKRHEHSNKAVLDGITAAKVAGWDGAVTDAAAAAAAAETAVQPAELTAHNTDNEAHGDIRGFLDAVEARIEALANSDDTTLDDLAEIVAYIKNNKSLIDSITSSKISTSAIVDNLTTSDASKVLSAKQGVMLKALIDGIQAQQGPAGPQGPQGEDYVLTDEDKEEIAGMAAEEVTAQIPATLNADFVFAMPRKIYLGPSAQDAVKLYLESMIPQRYTVRLGNYTSICEMRLTEDYLKLVPGTVGTKGIDSTVYDERMSLIESHSNTDHYYDVVVSSAVPASQTMLLIGDSFVEQGYIAPDLRGLFTADAHPLTLVGTKGSGADKHEGYAGKSAVDFAGGFSGSPFGESGFDFASYMTSHGYTVNSVYIQLGTNDVLAGSVMSDAQIGAVVSALSTIVGAIHTYSSSIKIVLGTTVGCIADAAKFAEAYYGTGEREIMQQNMRKLAAAVIAHFAGTSYVRVAPVVAILDPTEDFRNSVHPNEGGYAKMAKCVYDTMRGF